ncbi:MAG: hypothetical protein ACP5UI_01390 [Thermoprotei archaeon]|nr:hypothetical protein [TACK group archaeon]
MHEGETAEERLFTMMHNAGIVKAKKALSAAELAQLFSMSTEDVEKGIRSGLAHGYVAVAEEDRFYLSRKGILFVSAIFT